MPGAIAANLHEGSRSEYLAQYVFSSWGTAVAIPYQEDHGLDFLCSLTERSGQLAWARSVYTVQVKSDLSPWVFQGEESVRWLIEHPLPLFLCVVDKPSGRLRIYQTAPRFWVWALGELPATVALTPGQDAKGRAAKWKGEYELSLSAPILEFTLDDISNSDFRKTAVEILQFWIRVDEGNLLRIRSGLRRFSMPQVYKPNEMIWSGWESHWLKEATEEHIKQSLVHMKEAIEWLGAQFYKRGDIGGAVKAAILLNHVDPNGMFIELLHCLWSLDQRLREGDSQNKALFVGIKKLGSMIDEAVAKALSEDAGPPKESDGQ